MRFEAGSDTEGGEGPALRFNSAEEAAALHLEVTDLIREVMLAAGSVSDGRADIRTKSQAVMKRYALVMRLLNQMRQKLPHGPGE